MTTENFSLRANLLARRTYQRPTGNDHETWGDVCLRVQNHQRDLWARAQSQPCISPDQDDELAELTGLMYRREALPSGRILWLGGTEQVKKTEIACFNCSHLVVRDVYSAVDAFYLLLNGAGVGFKPEAGLLNGFAKPCKVDVVRSTSFIRGPDANEEEYYTDTLSGLYTWHLKVGDSGVAWAKALGKILAMKTPVDQIRLDFSHIRPAGMTLAGYGWLSSGDRQICEAFTHVCNLMSQRSDRLLTEVDIVDILNLAGTTLTSRRSAEIALLDAENRHAEEFATMKTDHYERGYPWRGQSNNSLIFHERPTKLELRGLFQQMIDSGGSEPGLVNGAEAERRAPWFVGTNPCGEILLSDGGLCNLVEVDVAKFLDKPWEELERAVWLIARANYRQTCVELKDGVLSDRWHETNQFLRLCGVGLTGLTKWLDMLVKDPGDALRRIRDIARDGADSMADELGLPRSKAVTTVKPSGTLGKIMDTSEGLHRPLGRYIFNWVVFNVHDPMVPAMRRAGYAIDENPYNAEEVIVALPVDNGPGQWVLNEDGLQVDGDSALDQLERYKLLMQNYVDHNASITVHYRPDEVQGIVDWLYENWDVYVGVSFMPKQTQAEKRAAYPYLPQEIVSEANWYSYMNSLQPVDLTGEDMLQIEECTGGACPVR